MAKAANEDNVGTEISGPDYAGALKVLNGPIAAQKAKTSSVAQDIKTLYDDMEKKMGINRAGAKIFAGLSSSEDTRTDVLRTLFGLCKEAGYLDFDDLVDRAQDETRTEARSKPRPAPKPPVSAADAEAAAKRHLGTDDSPTLQ